MIPAMPQLSNNLCQLGIPSLGGGTQLLHVGVTVVYITVLSLFMADSPDSGTERSTLGILSKTRLKAPDLC